MKLKEIDTSFWMKTKVDKAKGKQNNRSRDGQREHNTTSSPTLDDEETYKQGKCFWQCIFFSTGMTWLHMAKPDELLKVEIFSISIFLSHYSWKTLGFHW